MDNCLQRAFLGRPLDKVLKAIAIVDVVTAILYMVVGILIIHHQYGGVADDLERVALDLKYVATEHDNNEIARAHDDVLTETAITSSVHLSIYIAEFACEIYLFWNLWTASNDGNEIKLKRWWWIRLCVSLFNTCLNFTGSVLLGLEWHDLIFLTIFIYRFAELVLVRGFRKQIA
ncbi:unnamed protein product [Orchesella dallaii]|uniref:Uncharacterized protein n=1 Tax=Orchesella dallaii TaxID=48710 RepID=A0ABP1RJN5_9HEXA